MLLWVLEAFAPKLELEPGRELDLGLGSEVELGRALVRVEKRDRKLRLEEDRLECGVCVS